MRPVTCADNPATIDDTCMHLARVKMERDGIEDGVAAKPFGDAVLSEDEPCRQMSRGTGSSLAERSADGQDNVVHGVNEGGVSGARSDEPVCLGDMGGQRDVLGRFGQTGRGLDERLRDDISDGFTAGCDGKCNHTKRKLGVTRFIVRNDPKNATNGWIGGNSSLLGSDDGSESFTNRTFDHARQGKLGQIDAKRQRLGQRERTRRNRFASVPSREGQREFGVPHFVDGRFMCGLDEIGVGRRCHERERKPRERRNGGVFEQAIADPSLRDDVSLRGRKIVDTRAEMFFGPTSFGVVDRRSERSMFRRQGSTDDADKLDRGAVTTQAASARVGVWATFDRDQARTNIERCADGAGGVFLGGTTARGIRRDAGKILGHVAGGHRAKCIARTAR